MDHKSGKQKGETVMDNEIICERRTYSDRKNTHDHEFVQLIMPLQGFLNIRTDAKELKLDEKHLFLLPSTCQHTFWSGERNRFLVLDIPQYMFSGGGLDKNQGGRDIELDEKWQAIRFLLLNETDRKETESARIHALFHYFYPILTENQVPVSVEYIRQHYGQEISLEKLAALEHYNVGYFCAWFKKMMHCTPMEYLQKVRIEKSKQLLLGTNLNILQIAWEVGYAHQSSLNRIFRDLEGVTPSEFRRNNLKKG